MWLTPWNIYVPEGIVKYILVIRQNEWNNGLHLWRGATLTEGISLGITTWAFSIFLVLPSPTAQLYNFEMFLCSFSVHYLTPAFAIGGCDMGMENTSEHIAKQNWGGARDELLLLSGISTPFQIIDLSCLLIYLRASPRGGVWRERESTRV